MATRKQEGLGAVTIINNRRGEDMTGNKHEIADAISEGVDFVNLLQTDRKSTRLNSSHTQTSRIPSSA